MDSSPEMWKRWYDLEKPELVDMPKEYKNLDDWKKMLVLRVVRPDRVTPAMSQFIKDRMGSRYIDEEAFDMRACFNESSPSTPIFFVLFPGVDPTPDVEKLGTQLGFTAEKGNYINISMGQGQEQTAEQSLDNFAKNGGWVFLQNVHLMSSWLLSLERKLEMIDASSQLSQIIWHSLSHILETTVASAKLDKCATASRLPPSPAKELLKDLRQQPLHLAG